MNNRVTLLPVLLVCASFSIVCCRQSQVSAVLKDILTYIDEKPDSALAVLEGIDSSALTSDRLKAEYAMLHTMALDKCYIDVTEESYILPAVRYYEKHGTDDEKMRSLYYEAVIAFNNGEYDKAMVALTAAESVIPFVYDTRYAGLVYTAMSDIYNKTHNSEKELHYIRLAEDIFLSNRDTKYYYSTLSRKAQALMNAYEYDAAENIFKELTTSQDVSSYLVRIAKEDYALLSAVRYPQDIPLSLSLFNDVIADSMGLRDINLWAAYAYVLKASGQSEDSQELFTQLYETTGQEFDSSPIDVWNAMAAEYDKDYKTAYRLMKKSLTYQDSLLNLTLAQAATHAQNSYFRIQNKELSIQAKNRQMLLLAGVFLSLIIIMAIYLVYRSRNARLREELNKYEYASEKLKLHLSENDKQREENGTKETENESEEDKIRALRHEYIRMYKSHFKNIGMLCESVIMEETDESYRMILNKLNQIVQAIKGDSDGQKKFEIMINKTLGNVIQHFRCDFPKFKEEDILFVCCVIVGFDATTLSIIFNIPSVSAVYMRKHRIKKLVESSTSSYREEYLELIR